MDRRFCVELKLRDERGVDVVVQDDRIHALLLEKVDVLPLLHAVGHIVHRLFLGLFFLCVVPGSLCLRSFLRGFHGIFHDRLGFFFFRLLHRRKQLRKGHVLVVDVLKQHVIVDLVAELRVL
jgi:hypothetical protein